MKIAIVEDHALIAELLANLCRREFKFEVVLAETHGKRALPAIRRLEPDIVLLDLMLPDMDGLKLAEAVLKDLPRTRVLALSSLRDPATLNRVHELGLHGFVDKREQNVRVLRQAIDLVSRGHGFFSPVYGEVIGRLRRDPKAFNRMLSNYEQNVLGLIGESKSDEEIARILRVKPLTAQARRRDIMRKLGIHNTPKLIQFALENGFSRVDPGQ